jgi:hypothetical protein
VMKGGRDDEEGRKALKKSKGSAQLSLLREASFAVSGRA